VPTYNLVITDLIRYGSMFCVAGWDFQNGGMTRPEPPSGNVVAEPSRFWDGRWPGPGSFTTTGNIVPFDAVAKRAHFRYRRTPDNCIFAAGDSSAMLRHGLKDGPGLNQAIIQ
jgi:hypothetical protein